MKSCVAVAEGPTVHTVGRHCPGQPEGAAVFGAKEEWIGPGYVEE